MDDSQNGSSEKVDPLNVDNIDTIKRAFKHLHERISVLEQSPGVDPRFGRALKHVYDWAQHFGMKPLPAPEAEKPKPVAMPAVPVPEGFHL